MKIGNKVLAIATAISDVYRNEEDRELDSVCGKFELSENVTEDFTAMLCAMQFLYQNVTGDKESDLIDFTHILNKLAFQYLTEE